MKIQGKSSKIWISAFFWTTLKIFAGLNLVQVLNFKTDRFWFVDPGSFLDKLVDTYESDIKISQWLTTGLSDGEIMLGNPWERQKGVDMRQISEYRPVSSDLVVFQTLFPYREGLKK